MRVFIGIGLGIALSSIPQTHAEPLPLVCELTSEEVPSIKVQNHVSLKGVLVCDIPDESNQWVRECLVVLRGRDQREIWNLSPLQGFVHQRRTGFCLSGLHLHFGTGKPSTPGSYRENRDLIKCPSL